VVPQLDSDLRYVGAALQLRAGGFGTYRRWWAFKALLDYLERSPIATEFSGDALQMEIGSMKIWQWKDADTLLIQTHILDMLPAKDREDGKTLVCDWLTQNSKGLRVSRQHAHDLSKLLDGPLVEQGRIMERSKPEFTPKWLPCSRGARYVTLRYLALMPYAMLQIRNSLTFVLWGLRRRWCVSHLIRSRARMRSADLSRWAAWHAGRDRISAGEYRTPSAAEPAGGFGCRQGELSAGGGSLFRSVDCR